MFAFSGRRERNPLTVKKLTKETFTILRYYLMVQTFATFGDKLIIHENVGAGIENINVGKCRIRNSGQNREKNLEMYRTTLNVQIQQFFL